MSRGEVQPRQEARTRALQPNSNLSTLFWAGNLRRGLQTSLTRSLLMPTACSPPISVAAMGSPREHLEFSEGSQIA